MRLQPEEFADRHGDDLPALATMLSGGRTDAEDLLHDTYVKLLRDWPRFEKTRAPAAYARRTLVTTLLNDRRKRARIVPFPGGDPTPYAGTTTDHVDLDGPGPLMDAVARLPRQQRAVLVLRYWSDLDDGEIAEAMGIARSSVRSHATRALQRLRDLPDLMEVRHD